MRSTLLFMLFIISMNGQCQNWFNFDKATQTYTIEKNNVAPALLFEKFSLHSGIEVRFDKFIDEPLHLDFYKSPQSDLIQFFDKTYSTLKSYSKIKSQDVLTSIAILPKGIFQSDSMVVAIHPVQEAIIHQADESSEAAKNIYLTRIEKMNYKVKEQIQRAASTAIKMKESKAKFKKERQLERDKIKQEEINQLAKLKNEDPELYKHRISVLSWRDSQIDNKVKAQLGL